MLYEEKKTINKTAQSKNDDDCEKMQQERSWSPKRKEWKNGFGNMIDRVWNARDISQKQEPKVRHVHVAPQRGF